MYKEIVLLSKIWNPTYSDEGGAGEAGSTAVAAGTGDAGAGDAGTGDAGTGDAGTGDAKTFTQEEVNAFLAKEKRKTQDTIVKTTQELEATQKKFNLTVQEREELETKMEELRVQNMTQEELQRERQEKSKKAHETQVQELTTERDGWKNKFTESTILRSITDAAAEHDAVSPRQVVALLRPDTRLVEATDDDGKLTGELESRVTLRIRNEEGVPVSLDLSPKDAVAKMKDNDEFLNLFRGAGVGGVGATQQELNESQKDAAKLARDNPAEYRRLRKEGKLKI